MPIQMQTEYRMKCDSEFEFGKIAAFLGTCTLTTRTSISTNFFSRMFMWCSKSALRFLLENLFFY